MTYSDKALEFVLGQFLSEYPDWLTPRETLEAIRHGDDEVIIWEPFEHWDYDELADHIEEVAQSITDNFENSKG